MNNRKIFSVPIKLTLIFYIAIFAISVFSNKSNLIATAISALLKTPLNYIFLLSPIVITFFIHKKNNRFFTCAQAIVYIICAATMFFEISKSQYNTFLPCIGTLIISVLLICTNQLAASITLLPGLLLSSLGVGYIFIAYIPTLLFMLIKFSFNKEAKEKNISLLLFGAYLYIAVFAVLLKIKNKLTVNPYPIDLNLSTTKNFLALIAGILLVFIFLLFFIKTASTDFKKMTLLQKIATVLFAAYPVIMTVAGSFVNIVSSGFRTVFLTAVMIYTMGCIGIANPSAEKSEFVNLKHKGFFITTAIICFCTLCF